MSLETRLEAEMEALEQEYEDGLISAEEYHRMAREIEREYYEN